LTSTFSPALVHLVAGWRWGNPGDASWGVSLVPLASEPAWRGKCLTLPNEPSPIRSMTW